MTGTGIDLTFAAMALPFLAAVLAPMLYRVAGAVAAWVLALAPALVFVRFLMLLPVVAEHRSIAAGVPWIWQIDVSFAYLADGLSVLFALMISGTGALAVIQAGALLRGDPGRGRFQALLLVFIGASLGLVLADDFLMLFVFWEASAVAAFMLIGFDPESREARRGALQMLGVTGAGGLFLLAGFLLLILTSGASTMTEAVPIGAAFREHQLYAAVLALIMIGALTRAAQFPLHFWLPNVMHAPAPAAALFGTATLAAAGVYLLMRLHPILGTTVPWSVLLTLIGGATVVTGTARAFRETGLMRVQASSTAASLGLMVMLIGTSLPLAIMAAVIVLIAHVLARGALLMVAGSIAQESGATDIMRMGGLRRTMPFAWYGTLLAAWSLVALPLSMGSHGLAAVHAALSAEAPIARLVLAVAVLAHSGFVAVGLTATFRPFTGPSVVTPRYASDGPVGARLGPLVLGVLGILAVLAGGWTVRNLVLPATGAVAATIPVEPPGAITGVLGAFWSMLLAWGVGIAFYARLDSLRRRLTGWADRLGAGPRALGGRIAAIPRALTALAEDRLAALGPRHATAALFAAFAATGLWTMAALGEGPEWPLRPSLASSEWFIFGLVAIGLCAVVAAADPLAAAIAATAPGLAAAVMAMFFGAPDVAFALILVVVLIVVLLLLTGEGAAADDGKRRPVVRRVIDGAIALACGVVLCGLLVSATSFPLDQSLQTFLTQTAATSTGERNIVHLILTDVRALDMLGVAVVFLIAAAVWSARRRSD